jgi:hypothetical protein
MVGFETRAMHLDNVDYVEKQEQESGSEIFPVNRNHDEPTQALQRYHHQGESRSSSFVRLVRNIYPKTAISVVP